MPATRLVLYALAALTLATATAGAQSFPSKPMTLIVPFPPGAATDVFARAAGKRMGELLNQQIVVLNRDGASGLIGTEQVARAAPDGYTLLWGSSGPLAIAPVWTEKMPYEPLRDFAPVSLFAKIPYLLLLHPSVPAKNVKELVALAKAQPGKLNFASSGVGGTAHLAAELFQSMTGIRRPDHSALTGQQRSPARVGDFQRQTLGTVPQRADFFRSRRAGLRIHAVVRPAGAGEDAARDRQRTERHAAEGDGRSRGEEAHRPRRRGGSAGDARGVFGVPQARTRQQREDDQGRGAQTRMRRE